MKNLMILASLLLAPALTQAAMPCQWQSNYGYVKFITPSPYWNSVRVGLWQDYEHGTIHLIDGDPYSETAESPIVVDGHPNGRRIVAWELLEAEATEA